MKRLSMMILFALSLITLSAQVQPDFSMKGFAAIGDGTTGGAGGASVVVSNHEELSKAVAGNTPAVIYVNGEIDPGNGGILIEVGSNKTIIGIGATATISKIQLYLKNASNVIIRNLRFSMIGSTLGSDADCISIATTSSNVCRNIWIDHCEFFNETPIANASASLKDKYDGLIDIKKASELITISWCYFHDHYKAVLIGFTNDDTYDRKITMHNNFFQRIGSRAPSYRGGTAHIYNNYFEGALDNGKPFSTAINTREGACLLVENNYFKDMNHTIYCALADVVLEGYAYGEGNIFVNSPANTANTCDSFTPPYSVTQIATEEVPAVVEAWAGVGKLDPSLTTPEGGYHVLNATANRFQTVEEGSAIDPIVITWSAQATDIHVDGLAGTGLEVVKDATAQRATITGAPTEMVEFTISSLGDAGSSIVLSGKISIKGAIDTSIEPTEAAIFEDNFTTGVGGTAYGAYLSDEGTAMALCKYYPTNTANGLTGYILVDKKRNNEFGGTVELPALADCGKIEILCRASSARNITLQRKEGSEWVTVASKEISSTETWSPDEAKTRATVTYRITTTNTGGDIALGGVTVYGVKDITTGLDKTAQTKIRIVGDQLIIEGDQAQTSIYSVSGTTLVNSTALQISLHTLAKGVYVIVSEVDGKRFTTKLIR